MMPRRRKTMGKKIIRESLERLNLGRSCRSSGMTVWPLIGPDLRYTDYDLLDSALKSGACEVSELESPSVPSVIVANRSHRPILGMHGQLLSGAKQNRSLNLTTMFPPESETEVDVACVEQGRWNAGRCFDDAEWMQSAAGRTEKLGDVLSNIRRSGESKANQQNVWNQQSLKQRRLGSHSATLDEIEIQKFTLDGSVESLLERFECEQDQVGAILQANNSWAIEIFDRQSSYAQYHEPLLRSFMIEAIEATRRTLASGDVEPAVLMKKLWNLDWDPIDTRGIGGCFSSSASNTKSVALLYGEVSVSLSVTGFVTQT